MVDAHCHLNFQAFEKDVDFVIKEAFEVGVKVIVNVGTKIDSSKQAVDLAEKYDGLYASVGIHPHHADKLTLSHPEPFDYSQGKLHVGSRLSSGKSGDSSPDIHRDQNDNVTWLKELEDLAKHPKVISIGEIGLDYFSYKSNGVTDPALQKKLFRDQIELSIKMKKPLQIHNRQAEKDILDILINYKSSLLNPPGMIHCFSGSLAFLKEVLDMGFYVGFDGNVTYPGIAKGEKTDLKDLVKYTPPDRILTETDSPYLSPIPFRGLRNVPKNVIIVKEFISDLKHIDQDEFTQTINHNFKTVFGINI